MQTIVYDKAAWHIDAGEQVQNVLAHFKFMMSWCSQNNLLSEEGKEIESLGVDNSISLHSRMFTERGKRFMEEFYDDYLNVTEPSELMDNDLKTI